MKSSLFLDKWLNDRILFGMKVGLENMQEMRARLNLRLEDLRVIHLAGSNGKGTTSALLDHFLTQLGYRTARYNSPHLVNVCERIRILGTPVSEETFYSGLDKIYESSKGLELTFFETLTCVALYLFSQAEIDWVVLETGLGGRLDATNIVDSELAVLTSLSLEHTEILGETLPEILKEKMGIFGPGQKAIANIPRELEELFLKQLESLKGRGLLVSEWENEAFQSFVQRESHCVSFKAPYFLENLKTAFLALHSLDLPGFSIEKLCLENFQWAGRYQLLEKEKLPTILLDGAHNFEPLSALLKNVSKMWLEDFELILGFSKAKDLEAFAKEVDSIGVPVHLVLVEHTRLLTPKDLLPFFPKARCWGSSIELWEGMQRRPTAKFLITGSLYFVGEWISVLAQEYKQLQEFRNFTSTPNERV